MTDHDKSTASQPAGPSGDAATTAQVATNEQPLLETLGSRKVTVTKSQGSRPSEDRLRSKAKRARPHVLVILACLAWFITTFTGMSTGLRGAVKGLEFHLQGAELEWKAQRSLLYREQILYSQLDKLLPVQLGKKYMETYDDCLARALQQANKRLFGLGFQYPDIRNQTIDWTVENCGRLHHAPQVLQPTAEQAIHIRWAQTCFQGRRVAEKVLEATVHHVALVRSWFAKYVGSRFRKAPKQPPTHSLIVKRMETSKHSTMPFGFALECKDSSCRPVYAPSPDTPTDKARISNEAVVKSRLNIQKLCKLWVEMGDIFNIVLLMAVLLMVLELMCLVYYALILALTGEIRKSDAVTKEEHNAAYAVIGQIVAQVVLLLMQYMIDQTGCHYADIANTLASFGVSMLIALFTPGVRSVNPWKIYEAIEGLCLTAFRPSHALLELLAPQTHPDDLNNTYALADRRVTEWLAKDETPCDAKALEILAPAPTPAADKLVPSPSSSDTPRTDLWHQPGAKYADGSSQRSEPEHWSDIEINSPQESDIEGKVQSETSEEAGSDWSLIEA
jgi:hypothetical protein